MNILQVISSIGFFGAENMVFQLSRELNKIGGITLSVGVIKNKQNPHTELAEICQEMEIDQEIFNCAGKLDIGTVFRLRSFIKNRRINIIHSHNYKSNFYSYFASLGLPVSLVSTCHNWLGDSFKMRGYASFDRRLLRKFDKIVAVSEEVKEKIVESGIDKKRVERIANGIQADIYLKRYSTQKVREELGIKKGDLVIGTVGRISSEKNHRILLSIKDKILNNYPSVRFLIVGDGPLKSDLEKEFKSPRIIFTGIRRDLPLIYQCMDIFVLPSLTEGLPMVLLEAMASKLPVVATNVGAVSEVVKDGITGFLVIPGDEMDLLRKLVGLIGNLEHARKMGEAASCIVEKDFSTELMTHSYLTLYNGIRPDREKSQIFSKRESIF